MRLTDAEIDALVREAKSGGDELKGLPRWRMRGRHRQASVDLMGTDGHRFCVLLRQSSIQPLSFSVILAYCPEETTARFRLRRYNGLHGEHTNTIEGNRFWDYHIHYATERYQEIGRDEDAYAEPTTRYVDIHGALECLKRDCGITPPASTQPSLFDKESDQ